MKTIDVTNIQFVNTDGNLDETQFDTQNDEELAMLWFEFCKENDLITVVKGKADYVSGIMI